MELLQALRGLGSLYWWSPEELLGPLEEATGRPVLAVYHLDEERTLVLVEELGWLLCEYRIEWEAWDEVVGLTLDGEPIYEERVTPPGCEWRLIPEEEALELLAVEAS